MEQQQRLPFALIHVVHFDPISEVGESVFERVQVVRNVEFELRIHGPRLTDKWMNPKERSLSLISPRIFMDSWWA